ncbi:MAG: energy transducer TonB [Flavobacteriales bacterium]
MRPLILPLVFLLSVAVLAQVAPHVVEPDTEVPFEALPPDTLSIFTSVERSAEFPGGFSAMIAYLGRHIIYPEEEQEDRIEGKVILQFVVQRDGSVDEVQVLRGVPGGIGLEREAVRVVKTMPLWTPAMNNGVTVNSRVTVPVIFKLTK